MTLDEAIGVAIKRCRTKRGLSQESIGASQSFVSDVERGRKSITINRLEEFSNSLNVQPATLIIRATLIANPTMSIDDLLATINDELS